MTPTTNDVPRGLSRRRFIKIAGGALGVSVLACGGVTYVGTRTPDITLPESTFGEGPDRVLVAYGSKCGSTAEVAGAIAQEIALNGAVVDVQQAGNVNDLAPYRAVVVGSAVRMGKWMGDATDFVKNQRDALEQIPTAYFSICMVLHEDTEKNRKEADGYMDPVRDLVVPVSAQAFAGKVDHDTLSLFEELAIRLAGMPEGDYRNWDAIQAWAGETAPLLLPA